MSNPLPNHIPIPLSLQPEALVSASAPSEGVEDQQEPQEQPFGTVLKDPVILNTC
jgi:hypothetical protein